MKRFDETTLCFWLKKDYIPWSCIRVNGEWRFLGYYAVALVRTDISEELRSVRRLLVTASVVPSSPILVTLMNEALSSSKTSVLTRTTRCNIPKVTIFHSYRRENLKSYKSEWVTQ
jgi:hypothetical protein